MEELIPKPVLRLEMGNGIKFRPHHFMCTLSFRGKGYSLGFIKNYKKIVQKLAADENTLIEVVGNMDSICSACPNKINEILCKTQDKITKLDLKHQEILELKEGEILSWKEARARIKKHMTVEKFHSACLGCSWKKYGVCQESLENLLR